MIKKFIIFIIGSLFLLILWMSWSMIEFKSKQLNIHPIKKVEINENRSIKNLSEAITYIEHPLRMLLHVILSQPEYQLG